MRKREKRWQILFNAVMILISAMCIFPLALLFMSSITDENTLIRFGYSLFPKKFSLYAYEYLMIHSAKIGRAYGITILTTLIGVVGGLAIMLCLAYPLSRKDMPGKRILSFMVFFTMLFNGGLVPTYILYTRIFNIKNTIWSLILPNMLVSGFYVMILRTFFASLPFEIIESAQVEGANEWKIFLLLVLPLSTPSLATVGLFQAVAYWNSWFNGMVYLTDTSLYSIQNYLNRILLEIQFLAQNDMGSMGDAAMNTLPSVSVRMAIAVIGVIPILVIYPFFQKYFAKGLVVGAVKG